LSPVGATHVFVGRKTYIAKISSSLVRA
jgi:hypothetical protein